MLAFRASAALVGIVAILRTVLAQGGLGSWGPSIQFPVVTVSGAIVPDTGK
jgi:galactose oxidase